MADKTEEITRIRFERQEDKKYKIGMKRLENNIKAVCKKLLLPKYSCLRLINIEPF